MESKGRDGASQENYAETFRMQMDMNRLTAGKRMGCRPGPAAALIIIFSAMMFLAAGPAGADNCAMDSWNNQSVSDSYVFPNWQKVWVASFDVLLLQLVGTESLTGLTVVNFGTALPADIKTVYWRASCGATTTGFQTMTYAGVFNEDSGSYPAWTWAGASINLAACADMCGGACGGLFTVDVFTDIQACPVPGVTIDLGFPFNSVNAWYGSISDNAGCAVPWYDMNSAKHTVVYDYKEGDLESAAPGDTISYTVYYGKPGAGPLSSLEVMDTMPPYTHYLTGSGNPAPLPGWDPNPGPPARLRWSFTGPIPVTGGPTSAIVFALTVDWGNGESFEPGSGDVAAPEGQRLKNSAQVFFGGTSCSPTSRVTPPVTTVVRRFLFWKLGDNDILFSASIGQPADEMIYSIFIKNMSSTKTWWDVRIWDTVPAELDSWGANCGFEDACVGWTMTPSGCASASPGTSVVAGTTLLTWKLDMPPGVTLNLRWKAQVKGSVAPDSTALNRASVLAYGRTNIVDGTGHSGAPRNFTHQAPILLPTMYVSYMGMAGANTDYWQCCNDVAAFATQTYWLVFFPLNKKTNFSLYKQFHPNDAYSNNGGVSPTISMAAGGCVGGGPEWIPGCNAERAPAYFLPAAYSTCTFTTPFSDLFKLVSNSPLIWELDTGDIHSGAEASTYVGTTSLTYAGYASYAYARTCDSAGNRDGLYIVNTSETDPTTAHVFEWDASTLSWAYQATGELGVESVWFFYPSEQNSYMVISSDTKFIHYKALPLTANPDLYSVAPNKENGYLVNSTVPANFYAFCETDSLAGGALIVGNVGAADASYEVWKYAADNPLLPMISAKHQSPFLVGSSGTWSQRRTDNVPAGLGNAGNPHAYQLGYDTGCTDDRTFYKVKLLSGGPVEVYNGLKMHSSYGGGSVLHSVTGKPSGSEFWFHLTDKVDYGSKDCGSPDWASMVIDVFVPKSGVVIQAVSNDGYTAHYTTTGSDQCVAFKSLTPPALGARRNWKFTSAGGNIAVVQEIKCTVHQKIFTAPFLSQGVYYSIIAPPVAYVGQNFWITIIVRETGGGTKTDYTGTTSFTSTDPGAKIQAVGMDGYNYVWNLGDAGVKIFINVSFTRLGLQSLVAQDTLDGSITGLAAIMVVGADIKLEKRKKLSVAASGDTVQFWICWSNYSSASGFSFTITDAVPNGTTYVPELASLAVCGQNGPFDASVSLAASASTTTTPPTNFATVNPGSLAGGTTRWLRWTVRDVYVNSTGCVCFKVVVN